MAKFKKGDIIWACTDEAKHELQWGKLIVTVEQVVNHTHTYKLKYILVGAHNPSIAEFTQMFIDEHFIPLTKAGKLLWQDSK
jgi:hypothetical protein